MNDLNVVDVIGVLIEELESDIAEGIIFMSEHENGQKRFIIGAESTYIKVDDPLISEMFELEVLDADRVNTSITSSPWEALRLTEVSAKRFMAGVRSRYLGYMVLELSDEVHRVIRSKKQKLNSLKKILETHIKEVTK